MFSGGDDIPKTLLQQQIENPHLQEGEIEALLKILMKVNYSEFSLRMFSGGDDETDTPFLSGRAFDTDKQSLRSVVMYSTLRSAFFPTER